MGKMRKVLSRGIILTISLSIVVLVIFVVFLVVFLIKTSTLVK